MTAFSLHPRNRDCDPLNNMAAMEISIVLVARDRISPGLRYVTTLMRTRWQEILYEEGRECADCL